MADQSKIEWTDATWNVVTGCTKVSPGCAHCYIDRTPAFRMAGRRFEGGKIPLELHEGRLPAPLRWRKPRRVFVNSLSDLFHDDVPDGFLDRVFAVMAMAGTHTFQVLTKRPGRMRDYLRMVAEEEGMQRWANVASDLANSPCAAGIFDELEWPLPNVWLGVSVENQRRADERIPHLLKTPAAVRFLSCEPLLGPVDLTRVEVTSKVVGAAGGRSLDALTCDYHDGAGTVIAGPPSGVGPVGWTIIGGESGPGARPCRVEWVRSLVEQCKDANVPCFVKQLGAAPQQSLAADDVREGGRVPLLLKDRKGGDPEEWPEVLRVRQFPMP